MQQSMEPVELERKYGDYPVKICFAPQDVPGTEDRLLDLIMQAYLHRTMPDGA